jgi:ABC-type dipeptide/oligopeptide/nickel transport system ATPase component
VAALLDVKGLTVEFQGDRGTRKVLDRVDLQVQDGETLGIVGESGSGKSVLLTAVMGAAAATVADQRRPGAAARPRTAGSRRA